MKQRLYIAGFLISLLVLGGGFFFGFHEVNAESIKPQNFDVTPKSACGVELSWNQPVEVDHFEIQLRIGDNTSGWTQISEEGFQGEHAYIEHPLKPNKTYHYKLRSFKSGSEGYSDSTNEVSVITNELSDIPPVPTNLEGVDWGSGGELNISWSDDGMPNDEDNSGFRVFEKTGDNNYEAVNTLSLGSFRSNDKIWPRTIEDETIRHKYKIKSYRTDEYCKAVDQDTEESDYWVNFSEDSDELVVPYKVKVDSLAEVETKNDRQDAKFGWDEVVPADYYDFEVANDEDFNDVIYFENDTSSIESDWVSFSQNQVYYYRVRACNKNVNNEGCSDYVVSEYRSSYTSPEDLEGRILHVSGSNEQGDIRLNWEDNATYPREIKIYRKSSKETEKDFQVIKGVPCDKYGSVYSCPTKAKLEDQPLGESYDYAVSFNILDKEAESSLSNVSSLNLRINNILRGTAWTASDGYHGIGWVKFNSLFEGESGSGVDYSVQIDSLGTLSGYAWGNDYGWLSFNKADLGGCPSGACTARIDDEGRLSGWARFVSAKDASDGAWNGWVKLRGSGTDYGVKKKSDGYLYGAAWADDVGNWIVFGPTEDGTGETACVDEQFAGENMERMDVRILAAGERISCAGEKTPVIDNLVPTSDSVEINWENPVDYDGVNIYYKEFNASSFDPATYYISGDSELNSGSWSYTQSSLEPETKYTFYIEGELNSQTFDSLEESVTTEAAEPEPETYSFWCQPTGKNSIDVFWDGPSDGYSLALSKKKAEDHVYDPVDTYNGGVGSYTDSGLSSEETWNYKLDVNSGEDVLFDSCTTWKENLEEPSNLNVYSTNSDGLHVNWKDNAAEKHDFEIQRIKVTPDTPSFDHSSGNVEVYPVGDGSYSDKLNVYWGNTTNVSDEVSGKIQKSPYYHVIERTAGTFRGEPIFNTSEPSYERIEKQFDEDRDYNSAKTEYHIVDDNLSEATAYYYKIKACSYINVDITKDGDYNPELICSDGHSLIKANTTAPEKPTGFEVSAVSENEVDLSWTDNSEGEDGYQLFRKSDGDYESIADLDADTEDYTDSGLSPETSYQYKLQPYKENPDGDRVYSDSVTLSVETVAEIVFGGSCDNPGSIVFVSSNDYTGDFGGIGGADAECQSLADAAGLVGTYKAWIGGSDEADDPESIFPKNLSPYCDVKENKIADNWDDLTDGTLDNSIVYDENGNSLDNSAVWTNVEFDGTRRSSSMYYVCDSSPWDCGGTRCGGDGGYTRTGKTGSDWSYIDHKRDCVESQSARLFCFRTSEPVTVGYSKIYVNVLGKVGRIAKKFKNFDVLETDGGWGVKAEVSSSLSEGKFGKMVSERLSRGLKIVIEKISSLINTSSAAEIDVLNNYFGQFEKDLDFEHSLGYYKDEGLQPDTVYVYRVRSVYDSGGITPYASMGGAKTLPEVDNVTNTKSVGVCVRNSLCKIEEKDVIQSGGRVYEPESQCSKNADCRDVGTMRRFLEER